MAQIRIPSIGETPVRIGNHLRDLSEESNQQDNRLAAIEQAIMRIEAALKHFEQK